MTKFVKEFPKPTAIPRAPLAIAFGAAAALVALSTLAQLERLDVGSEASWIPPALQGNVLPLLVSADFWRTFPEVPPRLGVLIQLKAVAASAAILLVCVLGFRRMLRLSWSRVGVSAALLGAAPLVAAAIVPDDSIPIALGRWLGVLVATLLYGSIACIGLACYDLMHPALPMRRRARVDLPDGTDAAPA